MDILKDRKKELEGELEKAVMGFTAILCKDGETILCTRVPKPPKPELNRDLLRAEYPEAYDKYLVTPEEGEPEFKVSYPRKTSSRKTEAIF